MDHSTTKRDSLNPRDNSDGSDENADISATPQTKQNAVCVTLRVPWSRRMYSDHLFRVFLQHSEGSDANLLKNFGSIAVVSG